MYQSPQLVRIGTAEETVLGIASLGYDLDTHMVFREFEFMDDAAETARPVAL